MDITINELGQLTPDSYILLDMRGDVEVGHGIIPGAIHMSKEEILEKYFLINLMTPVSKIFLCITFIRRKRRFCGKEADYLLCARTY